MKSNHEVETERFWEWFGKNYDVFPEPIHEEDVVAVGRRVNDLRSSLAEAEAEHDVLGRRRAIQQRCLEGWLAARGVDE
jgi:hypothetical protein